jgi:hypothetical protein
MTEAENPHTERLPYCSVVYWQDGVACGKLDDWTQARLESMRGYPSMTFERAEKDRLETVIHILAIAFDCGRSRTAARSTAGAPAGRGTRGRSRRRTKGSERCRSTKSSAGFRGSSPTPWSGQT